MTCFCITWSWMFTRLRLTHVTFVSERCFTLVTFNFTPSRTNYKLYPSIHFLLNTVWSIIFVKRNQNKFQLSFDSCSSFFHSVLQPHLFMRLYWNLTVDFIFPIRRAWQFFFLFVLEEERGLRGIFVFCIIYPHETLKGLIFSSELNEKCRSLMKIWGGK